MTISELYKTEVSIRLGSFLGILLVMALWEFAAPRRGLQPRKHSAGSTISASCSLTVSGLSYFPLLRWHGSIAQEHGWGLSIISGIEQSRSHVISSCYGLCHLPARNVPCHPYLLENPSYAPHRFGL